MSSLSQYFTTVHPYLNMIDAIRCLRAEGIKTAVLTNNFELPDHSTYLPIDRSLFDVVSLYIIIILNNLASSHQMTVTWMTRHLIELLLLNAHVQT